ncbi:MAG: phosphoribosyl-AMP cyclohydrolase [Peptococcaceae bacterium]|nr:phosphoribosyl-AMP cyclohydrolase [Peptococcaceae bacterium]
MAGYSAADASADAAAGDGAVATGDVSDGGGVEAAPELAEYFAKAPLIPAIVVEDQTGEVLMLAYMNQESLAKTLATGYTWFYSRSRACLWNKGATSGHYQKVKSVTGDCDKDTLLLRVDQTGPACHTGSHSCFFRPLYVGNGLE